MCDRIERKASKEKKPIAIRNSMNYDYIQIAKFKFISPLMNLNWWHMTHSGYATKTNLSVLYAVMFVFTRIELVTVYVFTFLLKLPVTKTHTILAKCLTQISQMEKEKDSFMGIIAIS